MKKINKLLKWNIAKEFVFKWGFIGIYGNFYYDIIGFSIGLYNIDICILFFSIKICWIKFNLK